MSWPARVGARQVFPALASAAILLVLGISKLTKQSRSALVALSAGMAVYAVLFVAFVASTYAAQPQPLAQPPPMDRQAQADFGGQLRLVDYKIEQPAVGPDDTIGIMTSFQALAKPAEVYWLLLRLIGPEGTVATLDGVPANGNPTIDLWQAGQVFASNHVLTVPATTPPGTYRLEIGLHPMGRWQWLRTSGQDTMFLGDIEVGKNAIEK